LKCDEQQITKCGNCCTNFKFVWSCHWSQPLFFYCIAAGDVGGYSTDVMWKYYRCTDKSLA